MGALDLLYLLRNAGLVLTLTPAGALHAAPRTALTENHRVAIRAERVALVLALQAEAERTPSQPLSGNPLVTPEHGDGYYAGGWDDAEIDAFTARQARFTRMGRADADHLAERLVLRDRQHDDRRLCLECAALGANQRCLVAARGRLAGADRRLEPLPTILQRCPGFTLAPGS
jgi:hypothetical protein